MPRSGSNLVGSLLHSHPNIMSIGEIFAAKTIWGQPGKKHLNHNKLLKLYRNNMPLSFLKTHIFHRYGMEIKAVGFRFFYSQAQLFPSVLTSLASNPNIHIIHLKRKNLLENYVSLQVAIKTGSWVSTNKKTGKNARVTINIDDCLIHFKDAEDNQKRFESIFSTHPHISVYYESLRTKTLPQINKILSFLDVPKLPLTTTLQKQIRQPMPEIIENYDEVYRVIKKTKWHHVL